MDAFDDAEVPIPVSIAAETVRETHRAFEAGWTVDDATTWLDVPRDVAERIFDVFRNRTDCGPPNESMGMRADAKLGRWVERRARIAKALRLLTAGQSIESVVEMTRLPAKLILLLHRELHADLPIPVD